MDEAQREYVEEVAQTYADAGAMPRAAGRIYGYLLVGAAPHVTQAEVAEALGLSVASASSMLRLLLASGMVRKVPVPGARTAHYGLAGGTLALLHGLVERAKLFERLATRGLEMQAGDGPSADHLRDLRYVYEVFGAVVNDAIATIEQDSARAQSHVRQRPARAKAATR